MFQPTVFGDKILFLQKKIRDDMKELIFTSLVAMMAVSCFKNTGYETSYTLFADFSDTESMFTEAGATDSVLVMNFFGYGPVTFFNTISEQEPEADGGWALSKKRMPVDVLFRGEGGTIDPELDALLSPYAVSDTTDAMPNGGKEIFLVFHEDQDSMPEHDIRFEQSAIGTCSPTFAFFNTTIEVAKYFRTKAVEGDYFTVSLTGYSGNSETGSVQVTLADWRDGKKELVTDWKTVEISDLGSVQYIDFSIDAKLSAASAGEDLMYFCMDNFVASVYISQYND